MSSSTYREAVCLENNLKIVHYYVVVVAIRFSGLNNKAIWYMGKETNSPSLINTWLKIFKYLGLCKIGRNQKRNYKEHEFSYNKIVRFSELFEIILATHLTLRRLTSGTKLGLLNLMIKSVGTSLGFIVLISAASGLDNKKNIIGLLIYMPVWILIEVSLTRMSLSIVNDKGLIGTLKLKHINMCLGIFFATSLEYIFTLMVTLPISFYISSDLTLNMYVELIYVLPLTLVLILPIGLLASLKFSKQRDQKFLIPIILKGVLVFTPIIPIIKEFNKIVTPVMNLNPFNLIFALTSIDNLSYKLNEYYLTLSFVICTFTSLGLYIMMKHKLIVKQNKNTIEISI